MKLKNGDLGSQRGDTDKKSWLSEENYTTFILTMVITPQKTRIFGSIPYRKNCNMVEPQRTCGSNWVAVKTNYSDT